MYSFDLEEELLPFSRTVRVKRRLSLVQRGPDDDKFIECAAAGRAKYLVAGYRGLLSLGRYGPTKILSAGELLGILSGSP